MVKKNILPNKQGRFGKYGGRFVAETLVPALEDLSKEYYNV